MNLLAGLPVFVPLLAAFLAMLAWRSTPWQFALTLLGSLAHAAAAAALLIATLHHGHIVLHVGGWTGPVGITLAADPLGATLALMAAWSGLAITLYARSAVDRPRQQRFLFPLISVLCAGVSGAFLTGDLFNLYVWFEVLLMSSFVLLALGGARRQLEGAVKYVTLNLIASAIFLIAVGILYGITGTLNFADLAVRIDAIIAPTSPTHSPATIFPLALVATLLTLAFSIKAALFPLFFWLPASYHTPPIAVSALFAGLLTKVGVCALLRTTTLLFPAFTWLTDALLVIAAITMLVGVLGAASQMEFRRVLAFHSVSQVGYMVMGVALATPFALAAALLFIIHHNLVKMNLFLITGLIERVRGSTNLKDTGLRGLFATSPALSILFLITAMALAGMPPLSGFVAKLALVKAGLEQHAWLVVAAALATSIFTLYSMTKLWSEGFWRSPTDDHADTTSEPPHPASPAPSLPFSMVAPAVTLTAAAIALGIFAGPAMSIATRAGTLAMDRTEYVRAVLGDAAANQLSDSTQLAKPTPEAAP